MGELVIAIGNPLGFENSVSEGVVSGLDRAIPSGGRTPALVELRQTSAPISPGNSGGALVEADRRVIGISVAFIPPQAGAESLGFAIPSTTVRDVVTQLLETGDVEHAFLGVELGPVTPTLAERFGLDTDRGAVILAVEAGAAADEAGIEPGDVIVGIADRDVTSPEDVFSELREREPGETIEVTVVRDGDERDLEITLDERPS